MPALSKDAASDVTTSALTDIERVKSWSFTVVLSDEPNDLQSEALYARCPDATLGVRAGMPYAAFDREAPSLAEAVDSALRDLEELLSDVDVVRIEPDELVNAADIARRTGRTRASISQLIEGERGPGGFPARRAWMGQRPLWNWLDVAGWFASHYGVGKTVIQDAAFLSALNSALSIRRLAPRLTSEAERGALARLIIQDAGLLKVPLDDSSAEHLPSAKKARQSRRGVTALQRATAE